MNWLQDPLVRVRLVGVLLVALGILMLLGPLDLGILVTIAAVMLVVLGLLMLVDQRRSSKVGAAVCVAVGLGLLFSTKLHQGVTLVLDIVLGVILLLFGIAILRLAR
ncbi:MAG: hypothetical protein V4510_06675 [bacterium]